MALQTGQEGVKKPHREKGDERALRRTKEKCSAAWHIKEGPKGAVQKATATSMSNATFSRRPHHQVPRV